MRGVRIASAAAAAALWIVASPASPAATAGPHDPCARGGRDSCGTTGVGFYRRSAYGVRWFGDYRGAVPGNAAAFCIDLGYWYAGRSYRYRPQAGPLRTRAGELVPADRRHELAYALWRFGRSDRPVQQAAVMLYVHSLIGDARPGEIDPQELGPAVASLYRRVALDAERYHGPYRIDVALPARLLVGRPAAATVRVLAASGRPLPDVQLALAATGAQGAPAEVRIDGTGVGRVTLTPTTTAGLRLRLRTSGVAAAEPHVYSPTAGLARERGQRLALPAAAPVRTTVTRLRVGASPRVATRISAQVAAVGARISDTVTVSGLGGSSARVQVQLWGPFAHRTDIRCAGVPYWTGSFVEHGDSTTTTAPVRLERAGYYTYHESIPARPPGLGFVTPCASVPETVFVRVHPSLATVASARLVRPGSTVRDRIRVSGLGTRPATVEAELYGPFSSREDMRCTPATLRWYARIAVPGDSVVQTPPAPVRSAGFYSFRERLVGAPGGVVTSPCGVAVETALAAPAIVTGRGDVARAERMRAGGDAPVRLRVPALGIDAPVQPSGIDIRDGVLGVPADVHRLGWWRDGMAPGASSGAILLAGHLDSAAAGAGALFPLPRARRGELVRLTTAAGRSFAYRVSSVRRYSKSALPIDVFSTAGPARLVLVTCGGPFDPETGHYRDNIVVTALPVR
ncbi:MAG TPA: sortase [Gaiellaceae bacterium]|nr:sortase [Gaiellaceae bacterium]